MRAPSRQTIREAGEALIAAMRTGEVRRRGGRPYKPSAIRGYESDLKRYVYDDFGAWRLAELRRRDVQDLADRLLARGLSGSKVRNVVTALKVVYRRELEHDDLAINPTTNLRLPDVEGKREWLGTPESALALLDALPLDLRAIFGTALLAGLRRGELRALRVADIQGLDETTTEPWIEVERSWDYKEGVVDPKSRAGVRRTLLCENAPAEPRRACEEHRPERRRPRLRTNRVRALHAPVRVRPSR